MFIDALIDFYEQNGEHMQPSCHRSLTMDWILELDDEGIFQKLTPTDIEVVAPASMRTSGTLGHLVVDDASYVLGHYKSTSKAQKRYQSYCEKVVIAAQSVGGGALRALRAFLRSGREATKALAEAEKQDVGYKDNMVPAVNGTFLACKTGQAPSELHRALQEEWRRMFEEKYKACRAQCLTCGQDGFVLDRHEKVSLFGLYTSFVNMNKSAFMSHGLENSANAPMCASCASKYVQAMRYMTGSDRHTLRTRYDRDEGASGWVAWLREDTPDFTLDFLKKASPDDALDVLRSVWRSRPRHVDANRFYAACITASDHRFSIRNFLARSLGDVIEKTEEYFDRQAIVRYGERRTYNLFLLLEAAAPPGSDGQPDCNKLPPRFADALVEHVLTGRALPASLSDRALRRCCAEQEVPAPRAALLKLFLRSQSDGPMATKKLNLEHPDPAYHCGRLLAVADSVYNATTNADGYVSKRYYTSASTTPANVIGRIIPNVRHQLNKLQRTRGGQATNLDKLMTEIMGRIGDFPNTLMPNQQALFALGFYHQRDHLMTKSEKSNEESEPVSA